MFKYKKVKFYLPDKKGDPISIYCKMDLENLEKLEVDCGLEPSLLISELRYKVPKQYYNSFILWTLIFIQDLLKGRFFNSHRPLLIAMLKKQKYQQSLSDKELDLIAELKNDSSREFVSSGGCEKINKRLIIALCSPGPGVGKTTTGRKLENYINDKYKCFVYTYTIAEHLKQIILSLYNYLDIKTNRFDPQVYNSTKDIAIQNEGEGSSFKTRDILVNQSLFIQDYFGKDIFGKLCVNDFEVVKDGVIIIDDLRRNDEFIPIKEAYGDELIVINLTKENLDLKLDTLSEQSRKFESNLDDTVYDYEFVFKENYSNINELYQLVDKIITK